MGTLAADQSASDSLAGDDPVALLRVRLKRELAPGERLLWSGQPEICPAASMWAWIAWAGSSWLLAALGFVVLRGQPGGEAAAVAGILMFGVGGSVGFILSLSYLSVRAGRKAARWTLAMTSFALTDRRAIRWAPTADLRGVEVTTCPARSLGSVHRVEYPDGSGDVKFGANTPHGTFLGFDGVEDVARVEGLARSVLVDPDYRWNPPAVVPAGPSGGE